jgi:probable F420-dependent oxidoreductase
MKYGIGVEPAEAESSMAFDRLASAVEERGFESLFAPEHTHIPLSRSTPYPRTGALPTKSIGSILDPWVALAAAASVTKEIRLGTGVCLPAQHDPIVLAKQIATVDVISNGRVIVGVGGGWNPDEIENHGVAFATRWKVLRERVMAMKRIWSEEEPEYHGEFVNFDPIWCGPKPVQRPHPPVLLGGHKPVTLQRLIDDGYDGWIPTGAQRISSFLVALADLRRRAEAAGRDPCSIGVTVYFPRADRAILDQYEEAGVERVVFVLKLSNMDEVLSRLDRFAKLAAI